MSTAGRTEVALAAVLAATAGAVDVLAFTRLGQASASIVTGNLVVAGAGLGLGQPQLIGSVATAVVAFAVGVLLGGLGVRQAAGVPLPGVTTTYFTGTLTVLLLGLVTGGRVNGAAVVALLALLAGAVAAGLLVAHAATAAVLLPLALVVVVLVASTVRRRELWAERGR